MKNTGNETNNDARNVLTPEDLQMIKGMGIDENKIRWQLTLFQRGQVPLSLLRPATPGDGIMCFTNSETEDLISIFDDRARHLQLLKFVPASGAATRMFKTLIAFNKKFSRIEGNEIKEKAKQGAQSNDYEFMAQFIEGMEKRAFAFTDDLERVMAADNLDLKELTGKGEYKIIIDYLLNIPGLDYANLPKALLKFHAYEGKSRTALEEHLVEGKAYCSGKGGGIYLHFTVSPQHRDKVRGLLKQTVPLYQERDQTFHIDLSEQKPSTDTVAADESGNLFRDGQGKLVLRPGGHGALIENLKGLEGDVIFIKNIDNIVPDRLKPDTIRYKKMLGGLLIKIRQQVFQFLSQLSGDKVSDSQLDGMFRYCEEHLNLKMAERPSSADEKKKMLWQMLNRPIRVCGMVKNEGEPGGGPFWVKGKDGSGSLQIVEGAQIDLSDPKNKELLSRATHFNPVDLVCSIRDHQGKAFNLDEFIDHDAYFISTKSQDGKTLKALELPGLWNGAMAHWITLFVEVPVITFNPTKTVNDLLRPQHQPA